jgi:hypothetical protein
MSLKNLLSENMLRFGTKNLSESQERELVVKSIMETINQYGLHGEVKRKLSEQAAPGTQAKLAAKTFVDATRGTTDEEAMKKSIYKVRNEEEFYIFAKEVKRLSGMSVWELFNSEMSVIDSAIYHEITRHVSGITKGKVDLNDSGTFNHFMHVMYDTFLSSHGGSRR